MFQRTLRNIGWLLGSRAVNAALSLVYLALATRTLGLTEFGRFSLILVLAQGVSGIASFSSWQAVVRWSETEADRASAAGFALALDLTSVVGGAVISAIVVWTVPLWLPLPGDLCPIAFVMCLTALLAIRSTPTGLLRLHGRYDLAARAEAVLPATRAAGAMIAASAFPGIEGFVIAWAVAELTCAMAYWWFAAHLQTVRWSDISLRDLPARHCGVWGFVWTTNLSRSLAVASKQILLLVVGALGGAALAGGYRVASQLGQALVQLGEAVSRAIYPEFVRGGGSLRDLARKMARLTIATGLVTFALSAAGGRWAIGAIAGADFTFAYPAMVILSIGGAMELLGASWDALLVARGRAVLAFVLRAVPLIVAFALLPLAIGPAGLSGVALCIVLASVLTCGCLAVAVRPVFREEPTVEAS